MALAAAISFDRYLLGVGACIGLGLGTLNFRLVGASVVKVGAREEENKRRPLALNTMARMGIISAITIGLLFLSFNLGFGVLAGLAVFQLVLLVNVARSMFKFGPPTDDGEGVLDADVLDVVERSDDTRGGA
jgi:MFS superfamily sulfate permease-like transporter